MNQRTFRLISFLAIFLAVWQAAPAKTAQLYPSSVVAPEVVTALQGSETVRVIINLNAPDINTMSMNDQIATVHSLQDSVLSGLSEDVFNFKRRFQIVPVLVGEVTSAGLQVLANDSHVASIELDQPVEAHDTVSMNALQANTVQSGFGLTGQGVTAAVLDTGVDVDNADFSGRIVAQHCFTDGDCQPGDVDESSNGDDPNGHGTNVAGIIASNGAEGSETKGFAPGAKLVAVRVLAENGSGWSTDWTAGLEWIYLNLSTTPVDVINLSLGTSSTYVGSCNSSFSSAASIISLLNQAGVAVFASTGNLGKSTSIAAPACLSYVTAVGATSDSDLIDYYGLDHITWFGCTDYTTSVNTITCFTNSDAMMDIVAPGAMITSSGKGGGTSTYYGTSQASPAAAGVAALMLQVNPDLTPDELEQAMQNTGVSVVDAKNSQTFKRINALKAVQSQTSVLIAGNTVGLIGNSNTFTAVVDPFATTVPITYTWVVDGYATKVSTTPSANTASYIFSTTGTKTINLTVTNGAGSFTDTHTIKVFASLPNKSYLPVEIK
jgi:serine protease AprX